MELFLRTLKRYKGLAVAAVVLLFVDVAGTLLVPTMQSEIVNEGVSTGDIDFIISAGIVMLIISVVSSGASLLGNYLCARLANNVGRDIRDQIYDSSLAFSNSDFEKFGTGSMITRTMNDVNVIQEALVLAMQMVLPAPVIAVLGTILTLAIDVELGCALAVVVAIVIVVVILAVRYSVPLFRAMQGFIDRMNTALRESIVGVRVIRAFNKEERETKHLSDVFTDYAELAIKVNVVFATADCSSFLLMNVIESLFLWMGGNQVGAGAMEIGNVNAIVQYAMVILSYIMGAGYALFMLPRATACLDRCTEVIETQPDIVDGEGTVATPQEEGREEEVVAFHHLCFRFEDADEDTLHDIDFRCRRGRTTAIIGATGSGKSTVAKMLLRLHDATEGSVEFCGRDVRDLPQDELHARISYVPQRAWLFSGTVESNLRIGKEDATEGELRHALDVAQAGFVYDLPEGLQAPVSQGGTNFSGGQRQRLSIARALVKPADLYIFDDSFSALDFKTDAALRRALEPEMRDAAVLIIAQRVSTIAHADQIVVLQDGRIMGVGTHEELLETCPVYQGIVESQTRGGGRQ